MKPIPDQAYPRLFTLVVVDRATAVNSSEGDILHDDQGDHRQFEGCTPCVMEVVISSTAMA